MYCILFIVLFLFLSIDSINNSQINVSTLVALSTTAQSSQSTSDAYGPAPITNTPILTRLSSQVPIPSEDDVSMWSTDFNEFDHDNSRCVPSENDLDIIFVVDSSTNDYVIELNIISDIIKNVLPINSRVGLINFGGCTRKLTFKKCQKRGQFKKIISLQNDMDLVLNAINYQLQSGIHCKITISVF